MSAPVLPIDAEHCTTVLRPVRTAFHWSVYLVTGIALGVLIGTGAAFLHPSVPVFRCMSQIAEAK